MEGTMKQLTFVTKGEVRVDEVQIPATADNGILVKIAAAGICGSDVHGYTKGGRYGGIGDGCKFGHEFVGTVVEVGKDQVEFKVGDRVWVDPIACVHDPRFTCMAGGFAEYVSAHNVVKDQTVFLLPDELSFELAALIEPFGVGVHTKNRGGVQAGDKVLMWGAGPIGLMGYAAMKYQGVENIIVAEMMPERINFAKGWGADVFDNTDADVFEYAAEKNGIANINSYERADVDRYIDYVGLGVLINEYMTKGRCNTVYSTLGLDSRPLEINPGEFMSKQYTITGSRGYTPEDIKEVIEVLVNSDLPLEQLITSKFTSLDQATEAFETACDKNKGLKVIFRFED